MERSEIIDIMRELKLLGMRQAYDDILQAATRHKWRPQKLVGELLRAELAENTARSIRYQMSSAKFPIMKDIEAFDFSASPVNEELVRTLHDGRIPEARAQWGPCGRHRHRENTLGHSHRRQSRK